MSDNNNYSPPPTLTIADQNTIPSAQNAVPVAYLAGEAAMPIHWISPIYNPQAIEAPQNRPGKK